MVIYERSWSPWGADLEGTIEMPVEATRTSMTHGEAAGLVCKAWEKTLGISGVTPQDNFFSIGGDSLGALTVMRELSSAAGLELPLRLIFESADANALAEALRPELSRRGRDPDRASPVTARSSQGAARRASLAQAARLRTDVMSAGKPLCELVTFGFQVDGLFDVERFDRAIAAVIAANEVLRTSFPDPACKPEKGIVVAARQSGYVRHWLGAGFGADGMGAIDRRLLRTARSQVDVETGSLLGCAIASLEDSSHRIVFAAEHIGFDGLSIPSLVAQVSAAYAGKPVGRPRLQYYDFAARQRAMVDTPAAQEDVRYWSKRWGRLGPYPRFPLAAKSSIPSPKTAFEIPLAAATADQGWRCLGLTRHSMLTAAILVAIREYASGDWVGVVSPTSGRISGDVRDLIGYFSTMMTIDERVSREATLRQVARATMRQVARGLDHQRVPFTELLRLLRPDLCDRPPTPYVFVDVVGLPAPMSLPCAHVRSVPTVRESESTVEGVGISILLEPGPNPVLRCEFAPDLYEERHMRQLLQRVATAIEMLGRQPGANVADVYATVTRDDAS